MVVRRSRALYGAISFVLRGANPWTVVSTKALPGSLKLSLKVHTLVQKRGMSTLGGIEKGQLAFLKTLCSIFFSQIEFFDLSRTTFIFLTK